MSNCSTKFTVKQFQQKKKINKNKKTRISCKLKSHWKKSVRIVLHFFSIFFFFQSHFLVLLLCFLLFFFFQILVWHVHFFQSLICFLNFVRYQVNCSFCLLLLSIDYEYPSFLSSFFFALEYPGCSFLNHPNFYSFSQQNFPLKTI